MNNVEVMEKVNEALAMRRLNFTANMAETFALVDGLYVPTGMYTPVRDDKKGEPSIINGKSFTDQYHPIQHSDAFSVLGEMADIADIEFKNVGSWGNGSGVFAQISIGNSGDIGGSGDVVGRYLSVVNSHDGTRSLSILITPFRFFCKNQIAKAIRHAKEHNRIISIHHDRYGQARFAELKYAIGMANDQYDYSEEQYKRLADRVVTMDEVKEVMARCYPLPVYKNVGTPEKSRLRWEKIVIRLVENFRNADDGRVEVMTGWNLYNAIQGTYQHNTKRTSTYEKSLIMGSIASQARSSLETVQNVLFNGDNEKTEHYDFDRLFVSVA